MAPDKCVIVNVCSFKKDSNPKCSFSVNALIYIRHRLYAISNFLDIPHNPISHKFTFCSLFVKPLNTIKHSKFLNF